MSFTAPAQIAALHVALNTGMRKGEQFSLEWPQVDFARKRIYLSETKNGSDREIPLNRSCFAVLISLYEKRPDNGAVFRSSRYDRLCLILRNGLKQRSETHKSVISLGMI